ncbi:MAG TPA: ATP-binding protein [Pseudomonadota bacterium]|nr:ATP-binding protein [Pseudomonadota bacterium]
MATNLKDASAVGKPSQSSLGEECLAGGGEMGALMRSLDFKKTGLGPVAGWPRSLKTMVAVMLANRFPMLIWWGPELLQLYNDAYRPVLGTKHPASMGAPAAQVWPEIWDIVGPMISSVRDGGPATFHEHLQLFLNSRGVGEETFHTFSYSPIPDDEGGIGGVLNTVQETTEQVQDDRQLRMLRDLAARSADAKSAEEACRTAARILALNEADLPFALFYLRPEGGDGNYAELVSASGLAGYEGPARPERVALHQGSDASWPFREAELSGREVIVDHLADRFGALPRGRWGEPPGRAVVLPLSRPGYPRPHGFFVAGVSSRRRPDERYLGLFRLTADQVMTTIANARAYAEARRQAEALAEIDRAKTAFFSNVSHEFRTPLTLLLGPTEDALKSAGVLSGESLKAVHRNALRLLKLVNTLLDFSRIEAGREKADYRATDLAALTVDLASAFRSAIEHAGLRFAVDCPPLPAPVLVDRDMWEKIVLNLLSNALKFTFAGSISISLHPAGDGVELKVSDTGTGIPPGGLPHLFERFHRVQGARARTHEGSGIGLALVHELVRLHGGTITVASQLDEGTTFTVRLAQVQLGSDYLGQASRPEPRVPAALHAAPYVNEALRWLPDAAAPRPASGPASGLAAATSARILLADDNADMRDYVRRLLAERWEVEVVSDGAAALLRAHSWRPDLIVTDVMMPELDGFGLVQKLRADPRTSTIPVIMLSARAGEDASVEGRLQGANDYLVKPFSARELIGRVSAQLELSRVQRLVEEHLELESKRLHTFLMEVPAAIAILRGPELVYELANARYCELVGQQELIGRPAREALPELIEQGVWDIFARIYRTGEPFSAQDFAVRFEGCGRPMTEGFLNWMAQPTRDRAGNIDGVMVFAVDVTEQVTARRQLEQSRAVEQELRHAAETANRAKDEFLAMLGHELRNPLAPISTALHLMRLRGVTVIERERVVIDRQVAHLIRLVDDLLDVSRITRGKVELQRKRLEIVEAVAKAVEMASPMLEQRQHHLALEVPASGLLVDGDPTRLAQVLANLLTNAAKYTEPGGHIAVAGRREGEQVVITVSDDGMGISAEILPHIFELFMQERQALDRSSGGLGLGLAIVRSLVTMHGGTVDAVSAGRGCGSVFTVRLPGAALGRELGPPSGPNPTVATAGAGRTILVVDDNEDAAEVLAAGLEMLGHKTRVAHDGPEALRVMADFKPELALLDIGLPVMDGYELARRLRQEPSLAHTRLVAVTGYGQDSDRQRSKEAGFDAHLVKPIQLPELAALIKKLGDAAAGRRG